ncbi:hypothetical protein PR048_009035 [Dryococelus australis]|uniref:Chromo domain-containing protein n=1 Tax=Dryococelus australis TaxID=614101 RepID=A0ABQ9HZK3_9NEOP|nr:hypothetical protein PR048_009035 [Dryococelus australis]
MNILFRRCWRSASGFHSEKILKTKYPHNYLIENVLHLKGNKVLACWLGFDSGQDTWLSKSDITGKKCYLHPTHRVHHPEMEKLGSDNVVGSSLIPSKCNGEERNAEIHELLQEHYNIVVESVGDIIIQRLRGHQ